MPKMEQIRAGSLELQGLSGVALARGGDVLGVRLACPHPALGLFDGVDVLMTLDKPEQHAPENAYVRYSWRVPITQAGRKRYATWPRTGINSPSLCEFGPGEAARIILEWSFLDGVVVGRYRCDAPVAAALFVKRANSA